MFKSLKTVVKTIVGEKQAQSLSGHAKGRKILYASMGHRSTAKYLNLGCWRAAPVFST
jgi:hypothetical protein